MSEREQGPAEPEPKVEVPVVGHVVMKTSRFSKEVLATMISLASAAFGVVAALAWNSAINELFTEVFGKDARISALFIYAFLITLVGVCVIVLMWRLAARVRAQPLEFMYPCVPKY